MLKTSPEPALCEPALGSYIKKWRYVKCPSFNVPAVRQTVGVYKFILLYSGTWPSYLMDLLSLRLVGVVEARNYNEDLILTILTVGAHHHWELRIV